MADLSAPPLIMFVTEHLYSPTFTSGLKFEMTIVLPFRTTLFGALEDKSAPLKLTLSMPSGRALKEQSSRISDPASLKHSRAVTPDLEEDIVRQKLLKDGSNMAATARAQRMKIRS